MVQLYRREGADSLVNTQTFGDQNASDVAVLPGGGYVIVWVDASLAGGDSSGTGIKGQRFDSNGNRIGGEFLVNSTLTGNQLVPTVASLPSGRFVVTWSDQGATGGDTSSFAVRGQMFESNGTPVGNEFLINTVTAGSQSTSSVTALTGGGFAVSWSDNSAIGNDTSGFGIKAQLFDPSGVKVGGEISVNSATAGNQNNSSIIGLPSGGFAVAWISTDPSSAGSTKLQLFDSAGARLGSEIQVNDTSGSGFSRANIAALADGFVVTWMQFSGDVERGTDVRAQRFDLLGNKAGAEFIVHAGLAGNQGVPDAVALPGGGFIITWQGPDEESAGNVFGQIFDSAGGRVGTEFVVSSIVEGNQLSPKVAAMPSGKIVVAWSDSSGAEDHSGFSVKSQILTPSADPATDIEISATALNENAVENTAVAILSASRAVNSLFTYQIVADSTGGAFRIEGDQLVVDDNARLDFETAPQATLTIRATDIDGQTHDEVIVLDVTDIVQEKRLSADDEMLVNVNQTGSQSGSMVIALAGGGFAVIWTEFIYAGSPIPESHLLRLYNAAGEPQSGEILIADKWLPSLSVAPLADGGFVLTREVQNSSTSMINIKAQRYDSAGSPVGAEMVAGSLAYLSSSPVLVQLDTGGFVIAWESQPSEIHAQRFDSNGTASGVELTITNQISATPISLVATPGGGFAASWIAYEGAPGQGMVQFYDSANAPVHTLSVEIGSDPGTLTLLALAGGGYMLGWRELIGEDESGLTVQAVMGQAIGADGAAIGGPVVLATYVGYSDSGTISFAADPGGGFVATWPMIAGTVVEGPVTTTFDSLEGRLFDSSGSPVGSQFQVSPRTSDDSGVAMLANGSIVVAWTGSDSDEGGVFARVFRPANEPLDNDGDDQIFGDENPNTLVGGNGDDQLYGLGGDDDLIGGAGSDLLDGGAGADTMTGGAGNDSYNVDQAGDAIIENAGEGTDEIRTGLAAFSLAGLPNVENLTGTSNSGQALTGNAAANLVTAGSGNDFVFLQAGGNDHASGNQGNDVFLFGASLTSMDQVDGGDGVDQIALQGNYAGGTALTLGANVSRIENLAILAGSDTRFGDPGTNFYDYNITVTDSVLGDKVQMVVDANRLRPGEDLTFDGSAETDGSFFIYGGNGDDHLTGGAKNDVFIFVGQGQWGPGDVVIGGAGIDQLGLRDNYTIVFGAGQLIGIEQIAMVSAQDTRYGPLGSSYSYDLTMVDANVDSIQMTVDAAPLRPGETLTFNGSAEDDGSFRVFGGRGNDNLIGSQNGDILAGNAGADALTGGGGGDSFRYLATTDSITGAADHILDFTPGTDLIDLSRIDADTHGAGNQAFHWIGNNAFTGTFAASAGELRAYQSGNNWFVEGDTDGNGAADFVIMLTLQGPTPLSPGDFLL